jgi:peptidoglycan pentaglycine glycine transferase (the first glycine)
LLTIVPIIHRDDWHQRLTSLPTAHILQSWEWGEFKHETTGWNPQRFAYVNEAGKTLAAASVLTRRIGPLAVRYVPKGPVFDPSDAETREAVLDHMQKLARGAIWLKIDPDIPVSVGYPENVEQANGIALRESLERRGWRFSADQVQFRNTLVQDLSLSEEEILAGMNQGTRRKIRQAEKAGVVVREADLDSLDLEILYRLYTITGQRQDFLIRPMDYYKTAWRSFVKAGLGVALLAELDGKPLAGLVLFWLGQKTWYFYGMSSDEGRDAQPNYALQWAAIRRAKTEGYPVYDWWGAPDDFTEDDPMWGVFRFKEGFGAQVVQHIGAWDYAPQPWLYRLYVEALPRLMHLLRRS